LRRTSWSSHIFCVEWFLITYLILTEIELTHSFSLKNFYIRRVLRIWPLYFAVVFFSFIIYPLIKKHFGFTSVTNAIPIYHFTFLSNFDILRYEQLGQPKKQELMQNITWSVSVEEQFYIFWPLLFVFLPKRFLSKTIILIGLGSLAFSCYVYPNGWKLEYHTLSVLINLVIGGAFAYLIITYPQVKSYFENVKTPTILLSFLITIASLLYANELFAYNYGLVVSRLYFAILFGYIMPARRWYAAIHYSNSEI
jgi:peptidoglycan/LPS O-acetylase OafA/YrhL